MLDKLPYTLTAGVTATREGLVFFTEKDCPRWYRAAFNVPYGAAFAHTLPWPDAAARLRYREGEPWCAAEGNWDTFGCMGPDSDVAPRHQYLLHRLAAILCDGAEEFQLLYWCVTNLGGQ